jgi:hypothetical protein
MKVFVIIAVAFYVILTILFFVLQEEPNENNNCDYSHPCVRVCCSRKQKSCTEKFVRENLDSILPWHINNTKYRIFYGNSEKCLLNQKLEWEFSEV